MLKKLFPSVVGVSSILDISGDSAPFRSLLPFDQHPVDNDPWYAIGRDFEAVGGYLTGALAAGICSLPKEQRLEMEALLLNAESTDASERDSPEQVISRQRISDVHEPEKGARER